MLAVDPPEKKQGSWKQKKQNKKEPEKIQGSRDAEENKTKKATETKVGEGKGDETHGGSHSHPIKYSLTKKNA